MNIYVFLDRLFGNYEKATVFREKGIVRFEIHLHFTEFDLNESVELWLQCQNEMEVVWK